MVEYNVTKPYFGKMPKVIKRDNVEDCLDDIMEEASKRGFNEAELAVKNEGKTIDFRFNYKGSNRLFCRLERVYRALDKDIDRLNKALAANGKPQVGVWLASAADLRRAIEYEEGKLRRQPDPRSIADIMDGLRLGRTADGKLHYSVPRTVLPPAVARGAYATKTEAKQKTGRQPTKPTKAGTTWRESPAPKSVPRAARVSTSAASVLQDLGIDPRKGRAMLRRAGVDRNDAAAIRTYFKERGK